MNRLAPPLKASVMDHALAAVLGDGSQPSALLVYPEPLVDTAHAIGSALERRGTKVEIRLTPELSFQSDDLVAAASGWVPPPQEDQPPLLVLYGGQPWRDPFTDDYRVGIQAMTHREAQLARGTRILFVEWPYGARKDAEVDLTPDEVAAIFERSIGIDYDEMRRWNAELHATLEGSEDVRITCPHGTDITFSVAGRRFIPEDCHMGPDEPDVYLPGGEVYVAIQEESAEGRVAFRHVGAPRIGTFRSGVLTQVVDGFGQRDSALEEELGCGVEPLCEFGVGTNTWSPPWQIGTLYEKCAGTIHVAVGGNRHFGGQRDSPRHMDLVVRDPVVWLGLKRLALPRADWKEMGFK
jgi:hypothetical protein